MKRTGLSTKKIAQLSVAVIIFFMWPVSQDKDLDLQNPLVILWSLLWSPAILLRMALQLGSGGPFLWDELPEYICGQEHPVFHDSLGVFWFICLAFVEKPSWKSRLWMYYVSVTPEKINHLCGHLRPCGGTISLRTSKMSSPPTQSAWSRCHLIKMTRSLASMLRAHACNFNQASLGKLCRLEPMFPLPWYWPQVRHMRQKVLPEARNSVHFFPKDPFRADPCPLQLPPADQHNLPRLYLFRCYRRKSYLSVQDTSSRDNLQNQLSQFTKHHFESVLQRLVLCSRFIGCLVPSSWGEKHGPDDGSVHQLHLWDMWPWLAGPTAAQLQRETHLQFIIRFIPLVRVSISLHSSNLLGAAWIQEHPFLTGPWTRREKPMDDMQALGCGWDVRARLRDNDKILREFVRSEVLSLPPEQLLAFLGWHWILLATIFRLQPRPGPSWGLHSKISTSLERKQWCRSSCGRLAWLPATWRCGRLGSEEAKRWSM